MPHLFAVLDEGGRTLLVRTQGDIQSPSFPTLGLLCSIATFGSSKGYQVLSLGGENVRVVYEQFPHHLLFVLATSNRLASDEQLHYMLQVAYSGVQMGVGRQVLAASERAAGLEQLRRALRGMSWMDRLVSHEALFPCTLLPGPQWLGVPQEDTESITAALDGLSAALPRRPPAALLRDGLYMGATAGWRALDARQQLLLQHLATHTGQQQSPSVHSSWPVYVTDPSTGSEQCMQLVAVQTLTPGTCFLFLCNPDVPAASVATTVAETTLQSPISARIPLPQLSSVHFDMAAVVHTTPTESTKVTLYLGHNNNNRTRRMESSGSAGLGLGGSGGGFNPLNSPTARKQMSVMVSSGSMSRRTFQGAGAASSAEAQQLYYKASCDLLASFMLATAPHTQTQGGVGGLGARTTMDDAGSSVPGTPHSRGTVCTPRSRLSQTDVSFTPRSEGMESEVFGPTPRKAMAAIAQRFFSSFITPNPTQSASATPRAARRLFRISRRDSASPATADKSPAADAAAAATAAAAAAGAKAASLCESHMVSEGRRLVSVCEPVCGVGCVSVFVVFGEGQDRRAGSKAARDILTLTQSV